MPMKLQQLLSRTILLQFSLTTFISTPIKIFKKASNDLKYFQLFYKLLDFLDGYELYGQIYYIEAICLLHDENH
jgi:hypothetical protein